MDEYVGMIPQELAEKINNLNLPGMDWDEKTKKKVESLLCEAMKEVRKESLKELTHYAGQGIVPELWVKKIQTNAYTYAAEVASQCPLDENDPVAWIVAAIEKLRGEIK